MERWADEIVRRDPLRDRYVILYFSGEGKFVRMFSNVPNIPPIFPSECRLAGDDVARTWHETVA